MGRIGVRKKKKFRTFIGITFRLGLIVAALCLFISYISSYIDPSRFSVPFFFGLYFIPILAVNLLLFIVALLLRSKSAWIPFIAILPTMLFAERFYKFGSSKADVKDANIVKIETYNVGKFYLSKEKLSIPKALNGVVSQIKESQPDIVCLQEVFFQNVDVIAKIFPDYKYQTHHLFIYGRGNVSGNLILSKYEIIHGEVINFKHSTNLSLCADIVIHKDTIRVYNNHLESNAISPTTLIKNIRENKTNSKVLSEEIINVHSKLSTTGKRRAKQVEAVLKNIQHSPYPAIICGDLNDIPMSYTYHKLYTGNKDTFRESGKGFSATYSMAWPLLRIDYVFIPQHFISVSHTTVKCNYSDHYPVIAEFAIPIQ